MNNCQSLFRHLLVAGILLSLALSGTGCKKDKSKTLSPLDYSATAEQLFEKAMVSFERERWADAEKSFGDIRRQYPYSRFAPEAELRGADCLFAQGSHAEAAVSYAHFLKAHPTHPEADFAAFRRGASYFAQIPGDLFFMPPSHERDQSATRDARSALGFFIQTYPNSRWIKDGQEMYIEVENALVRHEIYVAEFYLKRDKFKAATVRLEGIGRQFSASTLVPDAMLLQAITFLEMNETPRAISVFNDIITLFPAHHQALRAEKYLAALPSAQTAVK